MESALYVGKLRHRRFSPKAHAFSYPVFMAFLDVDRLPELMRVSPFSGYNRVELDRRIASAIILAIRVIEFA